MGNTASAHEFAKNGDDLNLDKFLDENTGLEVLNAKDEHGDTALHYASRYGNLSTVCLLIKRGAAINTHDNHGITPLHASCSFGHTEVAKTLIDAGGDIAAVDEKSDTCLHSACYFKKIDTALALVELGANLHEQNGSEKTPLDFVKDLLEKQRLEQAFAARIERMTPSKVAKEEEERKNALESKKEGGASSSSSSSKGRSGGSSGKRKSGAGHADSPSLIGYLVFGLLTAIIAHFYLMDYKNFYSSLVDKYTKKDVAIE